MNTDILVRKATTLTSTLSTTIPPLIPSRYWTDKDFRAKLDRAMLEADLKREKDTEDE